jgi:hypothetical protein
MEPPSTLTMSSQARLVQAGQPDRSESLFNLDALNFAVLPPGSLRGEFDRWHGADTEQTWLDRRHALRGRSSPSPQPVLLGKAGFRDDQRGSAAVEVSRTTAAPGTVGGMSFSAPPKVPIGLRTGA